MTHGVRHGYGAAIKTGLEKASGDFVCIIDSDNSYLPSDLIQLIPYIGKYDMVVGARKKVGLTQFPLHQRIAKGLVSLFLKNIFHQGIGDLNSGFRLIKTDAVKRFIHLLPDGFSFTSSITLLMLLYKYKIKYVPINYFIRKGNSKVRIIPYVIYFVRSYWRIIYNYKFIKKSPGL